MKIGIPRALYFFKYGSIWEGFFKKLGCEVVISPPTNRKILEEGVSLGMEELCIPLKVFYGHCAALRDKCDFVFIPRYISLIKNTYTCPKFLVLPDVARFVVPHLSILTTAIKKNKGPGIFQLFLLGRKMREKTSWLGGKKFFNPVKMQHILRSLREEEEKKDNPHFFPDTPQPLVMVVGHPYNLQDPYINRNLLEKLDNLGVRVITPREIPPRLIEQQLESLPFLYWSEEKDIAGSAYLGLKEPRIQGIILVSSFGCGPDSLVAEQIVQDARGFDKPLMQLFLDENTSDVNIQTRLEAFVDMIERRVRR